ncbi:MAG: DUF3226 domain-containing protein [Spirulina sp.]
MTNKPQEIVKPKLLIGEGVEDRRFLKAFLRHLNITDIQVEAYSGKNNLSKYLKTLKLIPGFSRLTVLAITRDADDNVESSWDSICSSLRNNKFAVPAKIGEKIEGEPTIVAFLFPDGRRTGMLEDLCLDSLQDDPVMPCIDEYFKCVKNCTSRQSENMAKAQMHAWLSSLSKPDKRLAEASEAGDFNWNSPAFDRLKRFLQIL